MNKKIEARHNFMKKLAAFFDNKSRSFLTYIVDAEKFSESFFYDKKKFEDIDYHVDQFLEKLKESKLCKYGWLTQDCLSAEIGGDPFDNTTFFDNTVIVTVLQK